MYLNYGAYYNGQNASILKSLSPLHLGYIGLKGGKKTLGKSIFWALLFVITATLLYSLSYGIKLISSKMHKYYIIFLPLFLIVLYLFLWGIPLRVWGWIFFAIFVSAMTFMLIKIFRRNISFTYTPSKTSSRKRHQANISDKIEESTDLTFLTGILKPDLSTYSSYRIPAMKRLSELRDIGTISNQELKGKVVPALITQLGHSHLQIGEYAKIELSLIGTPAVTALIHALKDDWSETRARAADALGEIGNKRAIPALKELLDDQEKYVKESAKRNIKKIK